MSHKTIRPFHIFRKAMKHFLKVTDCTQQLQVRENVVGFEKALGAVKVIKDQIQYRSQSLLNLASGYFNQFKVVGVFRLTWRKTRKRLAVKELVYTGYQTFNLVMSSQDHKRNSESHSSSLSGDLQWDHGDVGSTPVARPIIKCLLHHWVIYQD